MDSGLESQLDVFSAIDERQPTIGRPRPLNYFALRSRRNAELLKLKTCFFKSTRTGRQDSAFSTSRTTIPRGDDNIKNCRWPPRPEFARADAIICMAHAYAASSSSKTCTRFTSNSGLQHVYTHTCTRDGIPRERPPALQRDPRE